MRDASRERPDDKNGIRPPGSVGQGLIQKVVGAGATLSHLHKAVIQQHSVA